MSMCEIGSAAPRRVPRRRAADPGATGRRGFEALCDVLLSGGDARVADPSPPAPAPPETLRGLYVLAMAGVEPSARRRTALAVARELAPRSAPAAVFLFENGQADAHLLGDPVYGRLGPQSYLASPDMGENAAGIAGRCDQIGLVLLDSMAGIPRELAPAICRAVFVATPDAESLVETYREFKAWRARSAAGAGTGASWAAASVFVVEASGADDASWLHERFARTARQSFGCDVAIQGFLAGAKGAKLPNEPLRLFAGAPSTRVWSGLLAAVQCPGLRPEQKASAPARETSPQAVSSSAAMSVWEPTDSEGLLSAVEVQVPALLGERCRLVLRVDVDEPDAPPLVAVRDDGALVAILIADSRRPADARAAERWLAVHRALLARAYPSAGISADAAPAAMVLAPLEVPPAADGCRRFLPVQVGGRQGIVLLP